MPLDCIIIAVWKKLMKYNDEDCLVEDVDEECNISKICLATVVLVPPSGLDSGAILATFMCVASFLQIENCNCQVCLVEIHHII